MRILLDECLPRRLARLLSGHTVRTVPEMGWASIKNGELLSRADGHFDCLITIDRSLSFQQNIGRHQLGLIVLHARSNRLADLVPLVPAILIALPTILPGAIIHLP